MSTVSETVVPLVNYELIVQLRKWFEFQLFFNRFLIEFELILNYDGDF